ncbi:MAG: HAD family hydrolase [Methanobacteriota archaeon]|nr:MAG: HAD family hydrolase [Euryarchaeota archaeon]
MVKDFDTIFFDLDGTLLDLSDADFEKIYIQEAAKFFLDVVSFDEFVKHLWKGTEAMLNNTKPRPVVDAFFEYFAPITGLTHDEAKSRFIRFYNTTFDKLKAVSFPVPYGSKLIEDLKEAGYKLVLATQPVFYKVATEKRIMWAGLDKNDFIHYTHAENSFFCKPYPQYFQSLLEISRSEPERTLMVGNDLLFDTASKRLGIRSWLTDTHVTNHDHPKATEPDFRGSLKELHEFLLS